MTTPHTESPHGYSWIIASIFIVGETAGSGLVAVPSALANTGLSGGLILLFLLCFTMAHTAHLLGHNWLLMTRRWPHQYANAPCRAPYSEMARRAMGQRAGFVSSICIYLSLFGGIAIFCLLAANNLSSLLSLLNFHAHPCLLLLAVAFLLWPFMMLRSPVDFWQVSIGAALSTVIAVLLILIGICIDFEPCHENASYPPNSLQTFSMGFGTIVFAYGGHPALPTIQNDMVKPLLFSRSVIYSYAAMLLLYTPIALLGFIVYGSSLSDSVVFSLQTPILRHGVTVMITLHVLFSILIIANPILQGAEQALNVRDEFGIGRIATRSTILAAAVFTAATVPNFGIFLDLIGGSSMTLLALVLPGLFALFLEAGEKKMNMREKEGKGGMKMEESKEEDVSWTDVWKHTNKARLFLEMSVIGLGLVCGITATINSLQTIVQSTLVTPCYVKMFADTANAFHAMAPLQCCGEYRNISSSGDSTICFPLPSH